MSGPKFLLILFGMFILIFGGTIFCFTQFDLDGSYIPIPILLGFVLTMVASIKGSRYNIALTLSDTSLKVNKKEIPFSEMKSYFTRNDTPKLDTIDIALSSGKEISVTGINHGLNGKEIGKFIDAMKQRFGTLAIPYLESEAYRKMKRQRKAWKTISKVMIVLVLLFDVFAIVASIMGHDMRFLSILTINLMLPMLRAFVKDKNYD